MSLEKVFPTVLTSSTRTLFSACPAKFFNSVILGLQLKKGESVHLTAGGAYADGLKALRQSFYKDGDYDKAIVAGLIALIRKYGNYIPSEKETKTLDRVVAAYVEYLVRHPPATDHLRPVDRFLNAPVEFSFAFEIPGCRHPVTGDPMLFAGTLDQLVEWNSLYFIYDDKTTKAMGPMWHKQWELRSQFTGYIYGLKDSVPEIADKLAGAIVRGMAILKEECKTQEVITYRPEWMIDRWKRRLVYDTQRMIQCWNEDYWPNQGEESGQCVSYGACPFHTLCSAKYPESYIDVEFEVVRKDPVSHERLGSEGESA